MLVADALIDIPSIRLEDVQGRRHCTGKVIMPSGGLTVLSRYLRASQGSCHDTCKYVTGLSPETEPKIPRCPMGKIVAPKRGRHLRNVEEDLTDTKNSKVGVEPSDGCEPQSPEYPAISVKPSCEAEVAHGKDSKPMPQSKPPSLIKQACSSIKQNPETTLYLAESNIENKLAESDQNNMVSIRPTSSSKDKSMKQNQNRTPIVRAPKKNMIYKPKGIHAGGLRQTPNGLNITQPSLASSSLLESLMSCPNDTSAEHDKTVAEKQKSGSKMMYKAKPKKESMITPINKYLPGKQLSFQRGKVVEIPVEDCTPRRHTFKKRELVDNRKGKLENFSTRRLKFRPRANLDNVYADNQNGGVEEFTPKRLEFRRREIVDNRDGDNQKSRIEEFSPRRLEFRRKLIVDNINADGQNGSVEEFRPRKLEFGRKLIVDNINGDGQNGSVEEFSPRKLELRRKLIVDNINGDNQNGSVGEFSPRKLEFRRKLIVDNIYGDHQNGRVEKCSPRRLEFSRSVLDNRNADDQNGCGEDSSPRKLIFRPNDSPTKNNFGRTEADFAWHNDTKIRSEKISLRHRDNTEKKGSGILYNNIIEEAASRLESTKASKVKALVSAFETVISRLDGSISGQQKLSY